jgi:hypothetical protein
MKLKITYWFFPVGELWRDFAVVEWSDLSYGDHTRLKRCWRIISIETVIWTFESDTLLVTCGGICRILGSNWYSECFDSIFRQILWPSGVVEMIEWECMSAWMIGWSRNHSLIFLFCSNLLVLNVLIVHFLNSPAICRTWMGIYFNGRNV